MAEVQIWSWVDSAGIRSHLVVLDGGTPTAKQYQDWIFSRDFDIEIKLHVGAVGDWFSLMDGSALPHLVKVVQVKMQMEILITH